MRGNLAASDWRKLSELGIGARLSLAIGDIGAKVTLPPVHVVSPTRRRLANVSQPWLGKRLFRGSSAPPQPTGIQSRIEPWAHVRQKTTFSRCLSSSSSEIMVNSSGVTGRRVITARRIAVLRVNGTTLMP
jgi:hypothetical protein